MNTSAIIIISISILVIILLGFFITRRKDNFTITPPVTPPDGSDSLINISKFYAWLDTLPGNAWLNTPDLGYVWLSTIPGYTWLDTPAGNAWVDTPAGNAWLNSTNAYGWLNTMVFLSITIPNWMNSTAGKTWLKTTGGKKYIAWVFSYTIPETSG
jgi:hypothetical protein